MSSNFRYTLYNILANTYENTLKNRLSDFIYIVHDGCDVYRVAYAVVNNNQQTKHQWRKQIYTLLYISISMLCTVWLRPPQQIISLFTDFLTE